MYIKKYNKFNNVLVVVSIQKRNINNVAKYIAGALR